MAVSLQTIRQITIKAVTQGVSAAQSALQALSGTQQQVAGTAQQATTATQQMGQAQTLTARQTTTLAAALEREQRNLDATYRATRQYQNSQQTLNDALAQGLVTQQRHTELVNLADRQMQNAVNSQHAFGNQTRLTRFELINLSRQVQDVGVSLASGQRFFTVMIQQGTQMADVFASSNVTMGGFARQLLGMVTLFRVVATGVGVLVIGLAFAVNKWREYALAISDLSARTDIAIERLSALQTAAAFKGVSTEKFAKDMSQIADLTYQARNGMGSLAEQFRANGVAAGDLEENMVKFADMVKNAGSGVARVNLLQQQGLDTSAESVRFWSQGGEAIRKAANEASKFGKGQEDIIKQARDWSDFLNRAWANLTVSGLNAIGRWLRVLQEFFTQAKNGFLDLANDVKTLVLSADQIRQSSLQKLPTTGTPLGGTIKQGPFTKDQADQAGEEYAKNFYDSFRKNFTDAVTNQPITVDQFGKQKIEVTPTIDKEKLKEELRREIEIIAALGDIATVTQKVTQRTKELELARLEGSRSTQGEINKIVELTRLREESSRFQQKATLELVSVEDALAEAERKVAEGQLTGVISANKVAEARLKLQKETLQLIPAYRDVQQASENFIGSMLQGFAQGKTASEALQSALGSLSSILISMGTKKLVENALAGLTAAGSAAGAGAGIGGALGTLGAGASGGAIGLAIAGIGVIMGLISNSMAKTKQKAEEAKQKAAEAAQKLKDAQDAWMSMQDELNDFVNILRGIEIGDITTKIRGWREELEKLIKAHDEANPQNSSGAVARGGVPTTGFQVNLQAQFMEGIRRLLGELASGAPELSEFAQRVKDIQDQFNGLDEIMIKAGFTVEEASRLIGDAIAGAIKKLKDQIDSDLVREINELQGKGWINQITDILNKFNDLKVNDLADPELLSKWLGLALQNVVDQAKLTGPEFQELMKMFPELQGKVHEFVEDIKRSSEELARSRESLSDRLFRATNDMNTIESQLAFFDIQAQREREAEIEAGGENIVLLESTLAAERLKIIDDFAKKELEDQRKKLEEQDRIFQEAQRTLDAFSHKIKEFIANMRSGSGSPLSPEARFNASVAEYQRLYSLAQTGTAQERRDAMDQLTSATSTMFEAVKAFNPAAFPQFFNSILAQLDVLPAQISVQDLILDQVTDLNAETVQMRLALLNALNTGNTKTMADALLLYLPRIDTNSDGAITFGEMQAAFGSTYSTGTLKLMFDMLDLNHDGILTQNELTAAGNGKIDKMTTDLVNALNTGNTKTMADALLLYLPKIDTNSDNAISFAEMQAAFGGSYSTGTLKAMFDMLDLNHDGILTQNELTAISNDQLSHVNGKIDKMTTDLVNALNTGNTKTMADALLLYLPKIDTNSDNAISFAEMQAAFGGSYNTGTLKGMFDMLDLNQDGIVTQNELQQQNNNQNDVHQSFLSAILSLTDNSRDLLNLMKDALTVSANVTVSTFDPRTNTTSTFVVQNRMIDALNKIVVNTQAIATNTLLSATNIYLVSGSARLQANDGVVKGGTLHSGGWINGYGNDVGITAQPGEFMVRRSVAQQNSSWLPTFNREGFIPSNDNVVNEIRALRMEVESLKRTSAAGHAMQREGIDRLVANADEQVAHIKLQTAKSR